MNEIWAIILAAGESARMKAPKMLLPYGSKTIIETVVDNVEASEIDKTLVVLGSWKDDILKVIDKLPATYCFNENYKQGMLSSVKCGFRFLPAGSRAALILLGDQPMVGPVIINMVISAFNTSGKGIIIPTFGSKRGHPVMIDGIYRDEIETLSEPDTMRQLIERHTDDIFEIETDSPFILKDIDTFEDYINEIKQIS